MASVKKHQPTGRYTFRAPEVVCEAANASEARAKLTHSLKNLVIDFVRDECAPAPPPTYDICGLTQEEYDRLVTLAGMGSGLNGTGLISPGFFASVCQHRTLRGESLYDEHDKLILGPLHWK